MHSQYQRLGSKGESHTFFRQLIITSKMVAKKIKNIRDNKSPGLVGFLPYYY